jgi:membrane protein required for colicin V production
MFGLHPSLLAADLDRFAAASATGLAVFDRNKRGDGRPWAGYTPPDPCNRRKIPVRIWSCLPVMLEPLAGGRGWRSGSNSRARDSYFACGRNGVAERESMPTWLDYFLLAVMLISGLLAMVRGFMREILSIASWALAAIATLYFYARLLPYAKSYIANDIVAAVVVIGGVFLVTLLVVSVITVRISDMILDSRVGALDRTLGFLFGLGRGLIIVVVAYVFASWLVPEQRQFEGIKTAKSRVVLDSTADWLRSLLPEDFDAYLSQWFKRRSRGNEPDQPGQRSELQPPAAGTGALIYRHADRVGMRILIEKSAIR